jgi:hypothetical protein
MFTTIDLLIMISCIVKKKNIVSVWKATDLSYKVLGGQLYLSSPLGEDSLFRYCEKALFAKGVGAWLIR